MSSASASCWPSATPQPHEVETVALQTRNAATLATQLRDATVQAPFAGTISVRPVQPGQYVQPGAPLLTLTNVRTVQLVVQVPEAELRDWRVGRALPVRFEAYPGTAFSGTVHHLGLKGGEDGRFPVEIQIVSNQFKTPLRVGFTARVSLPAAATVALTVPRVALATAAGGPQAAVYVLYQQRVRRRPVQVGASYGSRVAVRGVQADEQVVVSGTQALRDGAGAGGRLSAKNQRLASTARATTRSFRCRAAMSGTSCTTASLTPRASGWATKPAFTARCASISWSLTLTAASGPWCPPTPASSRYG